MAVSGRPDLASAAVRSLDAEFLLALGDDLAHLGRVLANDTEGGFDVVRWEKIDAAFFTADLELVNIQVRHDAQGFDLRPIQPDVAVTFQNHNLVFTDRHASNLVADNGENKEGNKPQREEDQGNEKAFGIKVAANDNDTSYSPLDKCEDQEKVFGEIKFNGVSFYHFLKSCQGLCVNLIYDMSANFVPVTAIFLSLDHDGEILSPAEGIRILWFAFQLACHFGYLVINV